MTAYIIRRIFSALVVIFGITLIAFLLIYAVPADPARMIAGPQASASVVENIRIQLGLNLPLWTQYLHYMGNLLHGNLGTSYIYDTPVSTLILQRLPYSLELALGCWFTELLFGIPLGIYTARHARRFGDYLWSVLALIGMSLPVFWLGLVALYWFGYKTSLFPLGGTGGIYHVILPSFVYGISGAAYYMRLLKSSMLEVMKRDYVRTARAKGLPERLVTSRHIVRNALLPVITFGGIDISYLLTGMVLMEATFNWNGIGQLAYSSIQNDDIPTIMGDVLLIAIFVVLFTLLVDIVYAFIDPRIRYD